MNARPAAINSRKDWFSLMPFLVFFALLAALTLNLPFFWDKDIFFSRLAHWLLYNHFSILLPDTLDPGYPPALGYLLAAAWKWAGISLPVMHLLMLPFTLGILWQTRRLLRQIIHEKYLNQAMILILADTTFLAQTVVYSTDLVMLFFMLLALNSILCKQGGWLAAAVAGLLFSHMRGVTVAAILGFFDLYWNRHQKSAASLAGRALPYLPGLAAFGVWIFYHYISKGWIAYHADSPWAACFEVVSVKGFIKNCAIVIWRLADFGHLFVLITVIILLVQPLRKKADSNETLKSLIFLVIVSLAFTLPPMLVYKMLNGHRYLIPVYYLLSVLAAYLLFGVEKISPLKKVLAILTVAGLLSGNFWIYPDRIAKGWDSTLAHLPYHHLRHKMMQFMDRHQIRVEDTGSRTPNTAIIDHIELNGDFRAFHVADLKRDRYIFYSNVINMFTDDEITRLKRDWKVVQEYRCIQVKVTLYEKKEEP